MKTLKILVLVMWAFTILPEKSGATSLWRNRPSGFLFVDHKARNIGDIITVVVSESVSIDKEGTTETEKKDTVVGRVASYLFPPATAVTATNGSTGLDTDKGYKGTRFGRHNSTLPSWDWKTEQKFKGGGSIKNDDTFSAKITARIIDVLPNGNMLIEGSRKLHLANEKQKIIITGRIRSQDISPENTINSEYIADMEITYEGKGPIGDNQRRGILTRVWDVIGLL